MRAIFSTVAANATSFFKQFRLERLFSFVLVGFLLLTTSDAYLAPNSRDLGNAMHQRLQQTDQNSERPKTTGEFLDEARGDVPLNERVRNITRDSAESLKQWGQEYSSGVKDNARNLKNSTSEASKNLLDR
jgi:hypothetical protein